MCKYQQKIAHWLNKIWYQKKSVCWYLLPLTYLYQFIIKIRHALYSKGLKKTYAFSQPIIIVGNITVGGTGKTPLVIWLANTLLMHGYKPGIVCHGYKGNITTKPRLISGHNNAVEVGDEAILIANHVASPVAIAKNRRDTINFLIQQGCNVIITDDGLQDYAINRDIEIAVIDGLRRFGNERCLPAGPLREPINRLDKVDFVIVNDAAQQTHNEYQMRLICSAVYNIYDPKQQLPLTNFIGKNIHAVAGIGNPQRFFKLLRDAGLEIIEHVFPDHHLFTANDINFADDSIILMTEKDAVKCRGFADARHWCVPVEAELPTHFAEQLLKKIHAIKSK